MNENLNDLAHTVDFYNTLIRLGLVTSGGVDELQTELDIIKYRSAGTINDVDWYKIQKKK